MAETDADNLFQVPNRRETGRWYVRSSVPRRLTADRCPIGSLLIIGGSKQGAFINSATLTNPTMEFYPPKALNGYNGTQFPSNFINNTLNANLFPVAFLLPGGKVFLAANTYGVNTLTPARLLTPRLLFAARR